MGMCELDEDPTPLIQSPRAGMEIIDYLLVLDKRSFAYSATVGQE